MLRLFVELAVMEEVGVIVGVKLLVGVPLRERVEVTELVPVLVGVFDGLAPKVTVAVGLVVIVELEEIVVDGVGRGVPEPVCVPDGVHDGEVESLPVDGCNVALGDGVGELVCEEVKVPVDEVVIDGDGELDAVGD